MTGPAQISSPGPARSALAPRGALDTSCRSAAITRRRYIRALATGHRPLTSPMRDALAAHVARLAVVTNEIFGTCDLVSYAWWLGLEIDTDDRDNLDEIALEVYIKSKISALADPHCALLAAIAADCEHLLDQPDAWRPGVLRAGSDCGLGVGGWLALVSRMSYRWTPWESRRLAAAEARCGVATGASSR